MRKFQGREEKLERNGRKFKALVRVKESRCFWCLMGVDSCSGILADGIF